MIRWPTRRELSWMLLGLIFGALGGWIAAELTELSCQDYRFSAHLRWDLGVECRK